MRPREDSAAATWPARSRVRAFPSLHFAFLSARLGGFRILPVHVSLGIRLGCPPELAVIGLSRRPATRRKLGAGGPPLMYNPPYDTIRVCIHACGGSRVRRPGKLLNLRRHSPTHAHPARQRN